MRTWSITGSSIFAVFARDFINTTLAKVPEIFTFYTYYATDQYCALDLPMPTSVSRSIRSFMVGSLKVLEYPIICMLDLRWEEV